MPDIHIVKELAEIFGVTVDSLLGRDDESFASRIAKVIREQESLLKSRLPQRWPTVFCLEKV